MRLLLLHVRVVIAVCASTQPRALLPFSIALTILLLAVALFATAPLLTVFFHHYVELFSEGTVFMVLTQLTSTHNAAVESLGKALTVKLKASGLLACAGI